MHSVRSAKSYYAAAFILGAIFALLIASPGRSADTSRLNLHEAGGETLVERIIRTSNPFEIHGVLP